MPTYDYECTSCAHTFELFQQITEKHIKTCPKCGKRKVQRLIGSGAAIIFKGSGFYQTDYRSKDYKSKMEADKKSSDTSSDTSKDNSTKKDKKTPTKTKDTTKKKE
ncbi:MAG: FmdB family zinc ribbon protein [Candidatus Anammoxibacter sp.]